MQYPSVAAIRLIRSRRSILSRAARDLSRQESVARKHPGWHQGCSLLPVDVASALTLPFWLTDALGALSRTPRSQRAHLRPGALPVPGRPVHPSAPRFRNGTLSGAQAVHPTLTPVAPGITPRPLLCVRRQSSVMPPPLAASRGGELTAVAMRRKKRMARPRFVCCDRSRAGQVRRHTRRVWRESLSRAAPRRLMGRWPR